MGLLLLVMLAAVGAQTARDLSLARQEASPIELHMPDGEVFRFERPVDLEVPSEAQRGTATEARGFTTNFPFLFAYEYGGSFSFV